MDLVLTMIKKFSKDKIFYFLFFIFLAFALYNFPYKINVDFCEFLSFCLIPFFLCLPFTKIYWRYFPKNQNPSLYVLVPIICIFGAIEAVSAGAILSDGLAIDAMLLYAFSSAKIIVPWIADAK